jgi:O-antigen/teichoic acid export membrane protein
LVLLIRQGWLRFRADRKHLRTALAFGIPLVPHGLSGTIKTMADRVIITGMISIADTGLYAVGFQVAMVIGLLEDAVNKAYVPWLFERLKRGLASDKRRIVLMTYAYCAGLMGLAVLLGITAPRLLEIFAGPRFAGSSRFVIWIAIGFAFDGMYKMVVNYIFFARRTKSLPWITFSAALIGVGLNLFVIRRFGAVGAAYTFALMNALIFVAVWIVSSRIYPMPWNLRRSDAR